MDQQAADGGYHARRLRESDPHALGELFDQYHAPLFRYAAGIAGDENAADVVQDVFLKVWEDRFSLRIRVSMKAMLYTMTRNRALNVRRKLRRLEFPGEMPSVPASSVPSDHAMQKRLAGWINRLPPRRAEAFRLSRYHELSHDQIARIMGLSVRTVQTHIVHALRDLRQAMEQWDRADTALDVS